jgi:hypothetical protein
MVTALQRAPLKLHNPGGTEMESSRVPLSAPPATALTRALCVLILLLMSVAMIYGAAIAIKNFSRIGV